MSKILLNLNAQKLQLLALHTDDGTVVNNAMVNATLKDMDGNIVPEVNNVTLANINVNGDYSYTIPATLNQAPRDDYRCVITATVGGVLILTQNEPVTIEDRVDVGPASLVATTVNFRPLVSSDIPNNAANTTGTSSNVTGIVAIVNGGTGNSTGTVANATNAVNVTGTVAIANGGTGQVTQQAAMDALAGTQSSGKFLRSDGTHTSLSLISAGDIPSIAESQVTNLVSDLAAKEVTANKNAAGGYAGLDSGTKINSAQLPTVPIGSGGTGQTTQQTAIDALTGTQSAGKFLRSDGTHATLSVIQASDIAALASIDSGANAGLPGAKLISGFLNVTGTGYVNLYTVPAGKRAFVKSFLFANTSGGSATFYLAKQPGGTGSYYQVTSSSTNGNNTTFSGATTGAGGVAGDVFAINTTAQPVNAWLAILEYDDTGILNFLSKTSLVSGNNTVYTVPNGKTAIPISSLWYNNQSGGTRTFSAYLVPSGGSPSSANQFIFGLTLGNNAVTTLNVSLAALNAGDFIVVNLDSNAGTQGLFLGYIEF